MIGGRWYSSRALISFGWWGYFLLSAIRAKFYRSWSIRSCKGRGVKMVHIYDCHFNCQFNYHFPTKIAYFLILLTTLDYSHSKTGIELVVRKNEVTLEETGENALFWSGTRGGGRTHNLWLRRHFQSFWPWISRPHFTPVNKGRNDGECNWVEGGF